MPEERLVLTTPNAPWLPTGSSAEVWVGRECDVPEPSIIVRLLLVRVAADARFFCVPTARGLDLPTLRFGEESGPANVVEGLRSLCQQAIGRADVPTRCVGYVRNVVPQPDVDYPHPTPWAHVPVFAADEEVRPVIEGAWPSLSEARPELSVRHWWPIVEHHLGRFAR